MRRARTEGLSGLDAKWSWVAGGCKKIRVFMVFNLAVRNLWEHLAESIEKPALQCLRW